MNHSDQQDNGGQERERRGRHIAEAAVLVVCSGLLAFMLGYSIYHGVVAAGTPPRLSVTPLVDEVVRRNGRFALPIRIKNETRPTVEDVRVTVRVSGDDAPTQERQIRIDYLPEQSSTEVYVMLDERPTRQNVSVDIESYKLP